MQAFLEATLLTEKVAQRQSKPFEILAPALRREAVAKLNEKPILALTLRLPWEGFATRCAYPLVKLVEREGIEPSTPAL